MSHTAGYPSPGETIGPYRIVRRLGFGGMGVVFEAVDGTLGRPVALKVISSHLADDDEFRARFVLEARAQASVRSPHVVAVHSHGEVGGRLYIATELVDAGDLGRLVQEHGAPPLTMALDILAQVASGLADAHAAGLVHRDIKPANVLLRRREHGVQAYLADFGIARQVGAESGLTMVGGTVGTPSYMAPELHTGARAGVESDIYSLGCLLWAAITGAPPYAGTSDYQIVIAHLERPVPQLRAGTSTADAVNQVLLRSLAKRPTERYVGAAALSRDLRAAATLAEQSGEQPVPVSSGPVAPPRPLRPGAFAIGQRPTPTPTPAPPLVVVPTPSPAEYATVRSRRVPLVVGAVVLVLAAGIGGALALATGDDPARDPDPALSTSRTSTSASPTSSPTPPTAAPTSAPTTPSDEERAAASLTRALVAEAKVTKKVAVCVAESWIDRVGLEAMIKAGFFDKDLRYVDLPQEAMTPRMERALTEVVGTCSGGRLLSQQ